MQTGDNGYKREWRRGNGLEGRKGQEETGQQYKSLTCYVFGGGGGNQSGKMKIPDFFETFEF